MKYVVSFPDEYTNTIEGFVDERQNVYNLKPGDVIEIEGETLAQKFRQTFKFLEVRPAAEVQKVAKQIKESKKKSEVVEPQAVEEVKEVDEIPESKLRPEEITAYVKSLSWQDLRKKARSLGMTQNELLPLSRRSLRENVIRLINFKPE